MPRLAQRPHLLENADVAAIVAEEGRGRNRQDAVARARGRCLLVSSAALANLPADWPHYVTAKSAVEGLLRWAAANNPGVGFFVTRPGMVLTDQTNTPTSREDAAPVENVAGPVSRRLVEAVMQPGRVVSLDAG